MKRGWTFVETLIVMAIVGLLAAIVIPAFTKARNNAKVMKNSPRTGVTDVAASGAFVVTFLFEKDGLKVYKFTDPDVTFGHPIYFVDGRGSTQHTVPDGKSTRQERVITY
jgi:prepilin-type N-terminal cleavage/methylation domain-containing protein